MKKGLTLMEVLIGIVVLSFVLMIGNSLSKAAYKDQLKREKFVRSYKYDVYLTNWVGTTSYTCHSFEIQDNKFMLYNKKGEVIGGGIVSEGWKLSTRLNEYYEEN